MTSSSDSTAAAPSRGPDPTRRARFLGVEADPLTIEDLNAAIATAIGEHDKLVIANHNLHSVHLFHRDDRMREFFARAPIIHFDSMPLVWWARILGHEVGREHRVTYVDWLGPLMDRAQQEDWRVFFLGARKEIAEKSASVLAEDYPGVAIGWHDGYFDAGEGSEDTLRVLDEIRAFTPNVVFVGMGMPRQEQWVLENLDALDANAILMAGAIMDFAAGAVPTPPRWMGKIGLEWLYRLFSEPRRLASRYLVEPWSLLPLAAKDVLATLRPKRKV